MRSKITEITNVKDFKEVYKVFSGPPYNEKYTDEELEEIFREYQEKGYIYGAFTPEKCIGLVAIESGKKSSQPVNFSEKQRIMYLADIAVLDEYRNKGLGNQLMIYAIMQSKLKGYDTIYMRTLQENSMSYGIASKIGFRLIPNVYQSVNRERIDGSFETLQNIFLELDLNLLSKESLMAGVSATKTLQEKAFEKKEKELC